MRREATQRERLSARPLLRIAWWVVFVLVLITVIGIRIRLLEIPLERDEGEYAYAGQLLLQGIPPYQLAYNMKFPGVYAAYALIMALFGQTPAGVHLGFLIVNLAAIALIFLIGQKLLSETAGLSAASAYAVLSVSPSVLGLAAHATHFVMLPVLGAILILLSLPERRSLSALGVSGFLFGLGLLMKQPGVAFVLFGAGYLVWTDFRARLGWKTIATRSVIFACGVGLPIAATFLLLWRAGVFAKFWFWTINYARAYGSETSFNRGLQYFARNFPQVVGDGWLLWTLAGIGAISCLWNARARQRAVFLLGFLGFSALALSAGLYFQKHYFIFVLPAVTLLAGAAAASLTDLFPAGTVLRLAPLLLFGFALGLPLIGNRNIFYSLSPEAASQEIYFDNPFVESIAIAKFLREHSDPSDTIAVLGSEPEIYFYSHRHSATGYVYTYALMEAQQYAGEMQTQMIEEIEKARPKLVVFVSVTPSWLMEEKSDRTILNWINDYLGSNYVGIGLVNIFPSAPPEYYLPLESTPARVSPDRILIYELKP